MSTIISRTFRAPTTVAWWEWGKLIGGVALVALLLTGCQVSPIIAGVVLHVACDFTFQSGVTAARKGDRGRHLVCHAIIAGGLPGIITGLMAGGVLGALVGFVAGVSSHYCVDYTRKFGVDNVALGAALDQAVHIAVLLVLA